MIKANISSNSIRNIFEILDTKFWDMKFDPKQINEGDLVIISLNGSRKNYPEAMTVGFLAHVSKIETLDDTNQHAWPDEKVTYKIRLYFDVIQPMTAATIDMFHAKKPMAHCGLKYYMNGDAAE